MKRLPCARHCDLSALRTSATHEMFSSIAIHFTEKEIREKLEKIEAPASGKTIEKNW